MLLPLAWLGLISSILRVLAVSGREYPLIADLAKAVGLVGVAFLLLLVAMMLSGMS